MSDYSSKEIGSLIKKKRKNMGFTQKEFSEFLGLNGTGERTVRGWENGEHNPSKKRLSDILSLQGKAPYKKNATPSTFDFIDLFAGIGGIRLPFQELGGRCVFSSEWDKFAKKTYASNFGELPHGDITQIQNSEIPSHDILLAGFPCQAFSQAGLKQGFQDTRGTMFFEIQRILAAKRPKAFLLENVKQLKGHDKGRTLKTILDILKGTHSQDIPDNIEISGETRKSLGEKLDYWVDFRVLRACEHGVPQNRERIYIVGFDKKAFPDINLDEAFFWPHPEKKSTRLGDILEDNKTLNPKYTISDKLWSGHRRRKIEHREKGNGFGYSLFTPESPYSNTISARYYKDGSEVLIDQSDIGKNPRKLTPRECARLQGFPEKFIVESVSDVQAYKQFGNSVTVPVIRKIATAITTVFDMQNTARTKVA
ncbi:DNA (cytosine-5-)-methyltransferase [uncultured Kiloniella sp.]|uniref:DNA (cytosine-5-)-methyltransferase n=1 Tax=uncultured Kiloniella sp. TaxID=1133091 RepID=UPI00262A009F|nr:DNA (cytosine-5-)-methyltransferase [uncultured Kiloniella sp.]